MYLVTLSLLFEIGFIINNRWTFLVYIFDMIDLYLNKRKKEPVQISLISEDEGEALPAQYVLNKDCRHLK